MATIDSFTADPNPVNVGEIVTFDGAVSGVVNKDYPETPFDNGDWTTEISGGTVTRLPGSLRIYSPGGSSSEHNLGITLARSSVVSASAFWAGGTDYSWVGFIRSDDGSELIQILAYFATSYQYNVVITANGSVNLFPTGVGQLAGDKFEIIIYFDASNIYADVTIKRSNDTIVYSGVNSLPFSDVDLADTHPEIFVNRSDITTTAYSVVTPIDYVLKQGITTIDSVTTTDTTYSYDHTAIASDDQTSWTLEANSEVSGAIVLSVGEALGFPVSFIDNADAPFEIKAKTYSPDITVNFKLIETSSRKLVSIDRGSTTDRYETTLTVYGEPLYIGDFIRAITLLRTNGKSVVINSPNVRIFGDNVDHSVPIDTLVYKMGKQKTVNRNVMSVDVTFLATDLTFLSGALLPTDLQCLQTTWSGYSEWNTHISETYNRNNYFVDREADRYIFKGSYIMDIEQNKNIMNYWKTQRGASFTTTDAQWGTTEMFGAEVGTGTHDVVMINLDYVNISPTARCSNDQSRLCEYITNAQKSNG
jgi:hypothetical protein